jgi:hypothetical protein
MNNLNKFTKAELISKFKKLETKNSNSKPNNQSKILDFISYFKGLILKFTLISIIIKTFKKYSLFSKIFRFANWIILSIFGISLIDNFPFNFTKEIRYILSSIVTYFSNTHFYSFIASIFSTKEDTSKISIREKPMSWEDSRNEYEIKQSKRNSKISEWLNPEPEVKEESNNKKYYAIAGMLILACLSWYYWDEIRTITPTITNYFRRPRPGNDGIGDGNTGMNNGNIQPSLDNRPNIADRLKSLVNKTESDQSQIELQDNTKNVASTSKLDNSSSDNSMNHYFSKPVEQQMTGLRDITGQDLENETKSVVNEVSQFLNYYDNASFPKDVAVSAGIYKLLKDRLEKLMVKNNLFWGEISDDDKVMEKLDRFHELNSQFVTQHNSPVVETNNLDNNNQNNSTNNQNILDNQSDTYEEVAVANIESRMAWSDRATPSVHSQEINSQIATPSIHSQEISPDQPVTSNIEQNNLESQEVTQQTVQPKSTFANLFDSIRKRRDDSHVVGSPSNNISNLIDNADNLDDTELLEAVKGTLKEQVGLKLDITDVKPQVSPQDLPKIDIDSNSSSDNSINQYFPKPDVGQEEVKSRFTNLFGQINSRRDDSNVVGSPNISQIGLQPSPSRLSPLNTKPSISNLLEDTQALFDDDDDEILPTSNIDKGKGKEISVIDDWDKVETNVQYGDSPTDIVVNLKYDNLWTRINSYRFVMNTGQVIDYPYNFEGDVANKTRNFDLSSRIETDNNSMVELREILIIDLNYRGNSVWKNSKYSN